MPYGSFERLALLAGGAVVLLPLAFVAEPPLVEVAAQVLLLGVLVAAVRWGRKGGMSAAVGASLAYMLLQSPAIVAGEPMTDSLFVPLLVRVLSYGIVGVLGGELCSRMKYLLSSMEETPAVDEWTRVYNQARIAELLRNAHGLHVRYGTPYGAVLVWLAPALTSELRPTKQRSVLRAVADHVRGDVRLVDDVGRLDDGRFLVLLPQTPKDGALVAAERVRAGVRDLTGARDESVEVTAYSAPDDIDALQALVGAVAMPAPETPGQSASGS